MCRNFEMSKATEQIIKGLLQLNPEKRLTATQVREQLKAIIDGHSISRSIDHLVPGNDVIGNNDDNGQLTSNESPFNEKWKKVCNQMAKNIHTTITIKHVSITDKCTECE